MLNPTFARDEPHGKYPAMTTPTYPPVAARTGEVLRHNCPVCQGKLHRTWRRPIDRFSSQFVPVHRFRCDAFACRWEGNYRTGEDGSDADTQVPVDTWTSIRPAIFVFEGMMAMIAALLIVIFTTTDWFDGPVEVSTRPLEERSHESANQMAGSGLQMPGAQPAPVSLNAIISPRK